jgi:hypothetical protein
VEDPIRQTAHLGVSTFTRVFAKRLGKGNYLFKRPHEGVVESALTEVALGHARE